MRESEITPELIALSKQAKELGFPQGGMSGDWFCSDSLERNVLIKTDNILLDYSCSTLILDFSICLAWLIERKHISNIVSLIYDLEFISEIQRLSSHHEAIVTVVAKLLEE